MSTSDDVDALSVLFVLQDAGVVLGCEDEEEVLALALKDNKEDMLQMTQLIQNIINYS